MAVKLHRCSGTFVKLDSHPCWRVEKALREQGIEYERVTMWGLPRGKRTAVIDGTGQDRFPAIEFEDGSWYREESSRMAERIRAGRLFEGRVGAPVEPAAGAAGDAEPA
jgi:hypothetical protein